MKVTVVIALDGTELIGTHVFAGELPEEVAISRAEHEAFDDMRPELEKVLEKEEDQDEFDIDDPNGYYADYDTHVEVCEVTP